MPRTLTIRNDTYSVATEEELLEFCNNVRQAGGADILEALLPSRPQDSRQCLIANGLNFGCAVEMDDRTFADGTYGWVMVMPETMSKEEVRAIADKVPGVRLKVRKYTYRYRSEDLFDNQPIETYMLSLPKHIGNAAYAFDNGAAFQEYVK